jgi:hypothetical protein
MTPTRTNNRDGSAGFVRVRRRTLKGGYNRPTAAASFDLVRAVRINGEARHLFVLGFGTLKGDPDTPSDYSLVTFWTEAVARLQRHGLTPAQTPQPRRQHGRQGRAAAAPQSLPRAQGPRAKGRPQPATRPARRAELVVAVAQLPHRHQIAHAIRRFEDDQ